MKRCSSLCLPVLIAGGLHAQINLDSGLVAHWELNDNALDQSPNLNNGTAYGPIAASDRYGAAAGAYQFNGTSDHIVIPDLWATPPDAVTWTAWFKVPTTYAEGKLIHHGDNGEFQMYTDSNSLSVAVHLGNDMPTGWLVARQKFVDDHWHFAAGRWVNGQQLELYYDGGVVATIAAPPGSLMDVGPLFPSALGKYRYNNTSHYAGLLDDVRIYDRFVNNAELDSLYGALYASVPERTAATGMELFQSQPNPANGSTTLSFNLPSAGPVSLRLCDLNGRVVKDLENRTLSPGMHAYTVDLSDVGSGVYFYALRSTGSLLTRNLLVE